MMFENLPKRKTASKIDIQSMDLFRELAFKPEKQNKQTKTPPLITKAQNAYISGPAGMITFFSL